MTENEKTQQLAAFMYGWRQAINDLSASNPNPLSDGHAYRRGYRHALEAHSNAMEVEREKLGLRIGDQTMQGLTRIPDDLALALKMNQSAVHVHASAPASTIPPGPAPVTVTITPIDDPMIQNFNKIREDHAKRWAGQNKK